MTKNNRSKFQDKWLAWKDSNGTPIYDLAQEDADDPYKCVCLVCNPSRMFSCDKGFERIEQHAKTKKHMGKLIKIEPGQMLIAVTILEKLLQEQNYCGLWKSLNQII